MADAAKKKRSFRLPLGVKRAVLKPTPGGDGEKSSLQFEAGADSKAMANDFDAILQQVMAATDPAKSSLSDEDNQQAAAIAKRLAEGTPRKPGKPQSELTQPAPNAAARPDLAADLDDDDLAEPADMLKLIQARESMATLKPLQPFTDGPPTPAAGAIKPFEDNELAEEEPKLQPFDTGDTEAQPELKPLPMDDDEDRSPIDADMLRALFADRLNPSQPTEDKDSDGPTSGGGDGGSTMSFAASPLPGSVDEPRLRSLAETLTPAALWLSITALVGSLVYGVWQGGVDVIVAGTFGAGLIVFATILIAASASKAYSPILLAGFLFKRVSRPKDDAVVLAGHDILQSLGLAEGIIDADADARLVTSRDGVVVYANDAYLQIAEQAGIRGATGLPPRIDRLFGQSGVESSKMFRLAKACRSGTPCEEEVTQAMGRSAHDAKGELPMRRFLVSVRPMRPVGDGDVYAVWRLQELEVARQQDTLKAAFANFPRAVIAVERSGTIAWTNHAADTLFGTKAGQHLALADVVLGEVKPLVGHLWEPAAEEHEARIRDRATGGSTSIDVVLTPFVKGGAGEGFICVEVVPKTGVGTDEDSLAAGSDLTDAPFGVAVLEGDPSADGRVTYVNSLFKSYFPAANDGARFQSVLSGQAISELMTALKAKQAQKPLTKPIEVRVGEGAQAHTFRLFARPVRRRRGTYGPRQTVLYAVDITYQRRMEEDHVQGQKLQQIGQIAGSVAHDFNNLLVVVMGSTELLMRNHPVGDPSYKDLSMIYETAQRAQNLTRNLLAFSRKQTLKPEVCSLTELLNDFTPALKRYVSEKVNLKVVHGRNVPEVKADKGQIHLAIMNLAVNARDAMPGGGSVTIETKHVPGPDVADYGYEVLDEVDQVLVEVSDTGGGVPADIAEKIFEPFFTTKGEGQGTGLGLSTVAGTIAQMGGRVFLFNRPGEGATFRIFLPAVTEEEAQLAAERRAAIQKIDTEESADPTGKGRILVVEDEDGVRSIVVRALGMCGYEIVEACDGDEALELIEEDKERFDLVLTDIMMPEMDGPTLIQEAGDKLQGAKVVFMSGYAEAAMREKLNTIDGAKYLQKPFTLASVAAVVKESLTAR